MVVANTEKKTRGHGPVTVNYLDGEGKAHKRIPEKGVVAVQVTDKAGKTRAFKLSDFSPAMINGLAAGGFGKKLDVYVRNTVKNDDTADVLGTATKIFDLVRAGKLYTREEGSGVKGKPFNSEYWITAMTEGAESQGKGLTKKQVDNLTAKLMSVQGKERRNLVLSWQKIPSVQLVIANRRAAEAKKASKTGGDSISSMF